MAELINLKVITPSMLVIDEQVKEVIIPGSLGEFGVLAGHVPFISTLSPGHVKFKTGSETRSVIIHGGLSEVHEDSVRILTDDAERPDSIDKEAAKKELELLESRLKELSEDLEKLKELNHKLKLARARAKDPSDQQ